MCEGDGGDKWLNIQMQYTPYMGIWLREWYTLTESSWTGQQLSLAQGPGQRWLTGLPRFSLQRERYRALDQLLCVEGDQVLIKTVQISNIICT